MDSQPDRVASLEQRIAELEQRLAAMEAARVEPATPVDAAPAVREPALPPPPPTATTWGPGPTPGAVAAASWAARPAPVGWTAPPTGTVVPGPAAAAASGPSWAGADSAQAQVPAQRPSLRDLEERFAGRALAWVGGIALIAAALFFLSIAFSRGWITEPMRVAIGLGAGSASLALGTFLLARRSPLVGNVLAGVGLGVISISLFAATRLYGLVPPEVGLLASLAAAVVAVIIAIRFDARSIAAYGLVAALIAPPLVGAQPTLLTLAFLAITLAGTTAISLARSWRWLPQVAFVLVVPQLGGWLAGDPEPGMALAALGGFWLVNVVAAAGEEVRLRRDDLRASSAMLVVANAAFLLAGLLLVLDGDFERYRGVVIALAALAHLAVGAWFLARNGLEHLFGNLVAATGVALLTIAAFVQLGASVVPVAWAAEAVALTWLAVRRRHRWSALGAVVLGGVAILHLVVVEYPVGLIDVPARVPAPVTSVTPSLVALGGVLLALALAAVVVPVRSIRSMLAGTGIVVVAYAVLFEAAGPALAAMLVMTALAALLLDRLIASAAADPSFADVEARVHKPWFASACALVPAILSLALLFATELPTWELGTTSEVPFLNPAFASLAIVLAGLAGGGVLVATRWMRSSLGGLAILLLAWGLAFQVGGVALVEGLAVLLAAGTILDAWLSTRPARAAVPPLPRVPAMELAASAGGLVAWLAGLAVAVVVVAPPDRLLVEAGRAPLELGWPLAFLALAATAVVAARLTTVPRAPIVLDAAAAVLVVYGVSVAVVAAFEGQVGGPVPTEELAKQAQVALSVTWTAIGAATLVAGIVRRRAGWRHAAFALLGLATAKVALIDLASLDVAYRALVLAGLGLLLLGSAYVVTRARGGRDEPLAEGGAGEP